MAASSTAPPACGGALLARSDVFVTTTAEKLITYALGRGAAYADMPAIRSVVGESAETTSSWLSL
jgi:hypothetical protein